MMDLEIGPRSILKIDDARLVFKNFKGKEGEYNRKGERNFAVVIETEEQYQALLNDVNRYGVPWNIKEKEAQDEGDMPFRFLPVKVKDEVKLANYVHMIVIPSEYKDQIMKVMPEQLSDRAFCLSHDKLDVWQWSEKVYSFVRDMAKSNVN